MEEDEITTCSEQMQILPIPPGWVSLVMGPEYVRRYEETQRKLMFKVNKDHMCGLMKYFKHIPSFDDRAHYHGYIPIPNPPFSIECKEL